MKTHVFCAALLTMTLQAGAAEKKPAEGTRFRLGEPIMLKTDRRSDCLVAGDLNGDGRPDLAVVNNDRGVLEVFLQQDKGDRRFEKTEYTLSHVVRSMAALDINGNGRTDLAMAQWQSDLGIMYQGDDGRLKPVQDTDTKADFVGLGDVDNDGLPDLLTVSDKRISILKAGTRGVDLAPAQTYFTTAKIFRTPFVLDADGDGRNDLVYLDSTQFSRLMFRLQAPEGTFPAEFPLSTSVLRATAPLPAAEGRSSILGVTNQNRSMVQLRLSDPVAGEEEKQVLPVSDPRYIGFDPETVGDDAFSVTADVDGDGRTDLLVASPKTASIRLVRQTRSGSLKPTTLPCLAGLRQMIAWPVAAGSPAQLLVLSRDEMAIGVARADGKSQDTLQFPRPLPLNYQPLAMAAAPLGSAKSPDLIVVAKGEDKKVRVLGYPGFDPAKGTLPAARELYTLPDGSDDPNGLAALDLNQDGQADLVLFFEYQDPRVLVQSKPGVFTPLSVTGILSGMLHGANAKTLVPVRLGEEGASDLVAVKDGYVRAFHLTRGGEVEISDQMNARNAKGRLKMVTVSGLRGEKFRDTAMYDAGNKCITVYGPKEKGKAPEVLRHIDTDDADYQAMQSFDLDGDDRDDLLLIAPDRIVVYYSRLITGGLETVSTTKTPVEDGGYGDVNTAQLIAGGSDEIMALETKEAMLEFFRVPPKGGDKGALDPFYHFVVYESDANLAQRPNMDVPPEPRDYVTADFNEDGRADLAILVHDRIIVYLQLAPGQEETRPPAAEKPRGGTPTATPTPTPSVTPKPVKKAEKKAEKGKKPAK